MSRPGRLLAVTASLLLTLSGLGSVPASATPRPDPFDGELCFEVPLNSGSGGTTVICIPILVKREGPGIPPRPCICPYAFRFTFRGYLRPDLTLQLHRQVVTALEDLGKATGPGPQPWRQQALTDLTAAARTLGGTTLTTPMVGYFSPDHRFIPQPDPWRQQLGDHLVSAVTTAQLAKPGPLPWQQVAMNELDAAYTLYARYATPAARRRPAQPPDGRRSSMDHEDRRAMNGSSQWARVEPEQCSSGPRRASGQTATQGPACFPDSVVVCSLW